MFLFKHIMCFLLMSTNFLRSDGFNLGINRRTALKTTLLASSNLNLSNNLNYNMNVIDYTSGNILNDDDTSEKPVKVGRSKNSIYLTGPLTDETCFSITQILLGYKNQLLHDNNQFSSLNLYIQSPGGSLLPTLALVDEIRTFDIPVNTYIRGYAASAATLLSVVGKKRYMYNHSLMMIHGIKLNEYKTSSLLEVKDLNDNVNLFMKTIKNIYLENSNISEQQLEKYFLRDKWISSHEALSYGLIDEII